MYVLIEYNKNYNQNIKQLEKNNLISILLFKIILTDKNQTKQNLEKIFELKKKINPKFSAIQIRIDKITNQTQSIINNLKQDFDLIIGLGGLNKINRFFLEQTKIDFLQDPQNSSFKIKFDFIHHFNSGLNHILSKMAQNKQIGFIFSLNFTQTSNKLIIAKEIGRIDQNIKFARKYKIPIYLNFIIQNQNQIKTQQQIQEISKIFTISTQQINQITTILEQKIKKNKEKKSKNYISENIKIIEGN